MWTWPLDSAIGATTAHRASGGVADRTCTQVWAWMTNKCRKRMNQKKRIYNTKDLPQEEDGEAKGAGNSHPRTRSPFSRGIRPSDYVFLVPIWSSPIPTQAVPPSEPNFWTHSLQIHCNGSTGPRSRPSLGPVRKPWPYSRHSPIGCPFLSL